MRLVSAGSMVGALIVALVMVGCGGTADAPSASASASSPRPGTVRYAVPSGSMLPTVKVGSIVTVDLNAYRTRTPALGDIVIFHPPKNYSVGCLNPTEGGTGGRGQKPCGVARKEKSGATFIKRIVGLPGDRIAMNNGHVYRNGVRETDPYIARCGDLPTCDYPVAITVPRGDYYLMGDNRGESDDSRFFGPVPKSWIIGKVVGR